MAAHPDNFSAALSGEGKFKNKAFFFVDGHYLKYDMLADKACSGYPKQVKQGWNGLTTSFHTGIQAAVNGSAQFAGKAYMFKGTQYIRYNWATDRMDSQYPKTIKQGWHGLPAMFHSNLDAAVLGQKQFANKIYFFKGDSYVRYDIPSDKMDGGYPQAIKQGWHGLPASFISNFDAALAGSGKFSGKVYFFKGMQYVRYDWANDRMDSGYPKDVIYNWHDIFSGYGYKSSDEVKRIVQGTLKSKLKSSFRIYLGDKVYYCPPLADVQAILRSNTINLRPWISEKHDCDDFAFLLKAAFIDDQYRDGSRRYPYCVGIIWGDKLGGGPHAMNWMINSDDKFRLIEPQTDTIRDPGKNDSGIYFAVC